MKFTNAVSLTRVPFKKNRLMQICLVVFLVIWGITLVYTPDIKNWCLENTLVILFGGFLFFFYRKYQFSDLSYLLITIYLLLHIYGAMYTYAENPLGYWLSDLFHTERNFYDRIVHFSFGFMLAYPVREVLLNVYKFPKGFAWGLPVEFTLSISGMYELIEWAVADVFFKAQGMAYLGTQGDVWDAQKDMFLATLGAVLATTIVSSIKKVWKIEAK
jgi:putative membrane protein